MMTTMMMTMTSSAPQATAMAPKAPSKAPKAPSKAPPTAFMAPWTTTTSEAEATTPSLVSPRGLVSPPLATTPSASLATATASATAAMPSASAAVQLVVQLTQPSLRAGVPARCLRASLGYFACADTARAAMGLADRVFGFAIARVHSMTHDAADLAVSLPSRHLSVVHFQGDLRVATWDQIQRTLARDFDRGRFAPGHLATDDALLHEELRLERQRDLAFDALAQTVLGLGERFTPEFFQPTHVSLDLGRLVRVHMRDWARGVCDLVMDPVNNAALVAIEAGLHGEVAEVPSHLEDWALLLGHALWLAQLSDTALDWSFVEDPRMDARAAFTASEVELVEGVLFDRHISHQSATCVAETCAAAATKASSWEVCLDDDDSDGVDADADA